MDESSGQGQKASTRMKPCCHGYRSHQNEPLRRHRHYRPASQKVERVTFHRGDGTLHIGSIRGKAHPLPQAHVVMVSIPVGHGGHVREGSKCKHAHSAGAKITSKRTAVGQFKGQFNGAMDESSGQGQKASTRKKPSCHGYRSLQN